MISGQIVTMARDGKLEHFAVVGYVVVPYGKAVDSPTAGKFIW